MSREWDLGSENGIFLESAAYPLPELQAPGSPLGRVGGYRACTLPNSNKRAWRPTGADQTPSLATAETGPLLLTTPPPPSGGGSAPGTDPGHAPRILPARGGGAGGGTAASRAAARGTDPRGPDGAASEGAAAPEEGAEDRGEPADLVGSLAPAQGEPSRPSSRPRPASRGIRPLGLQPYPPSESGSSDPQAHPTWTQESESPASSFLGPRPLGLSAYILPTDGGGSGPSAGRAGWRAGGCPARGGAAPGAAGTAGGHGAGQPGAAGTGQCVLLDLHHQFPSLSEGYSWWCPWDLSPIPQRDTGAGGGGWVDAPCFPPPSWTMILRPDTLGSLPLPLSLCSLNVIL